MAIFEKEFEQVIIDELIPLISEDDYQNTEGKILEIIQEMYKSIPDKKRISYGRTYVYRELSKSVYNLMKDVDGNKAIFMSNYEHMTIVASKSVFVGALSFIAMDLNEDLLTFFEKVAASEEWETRELAQFNFRKVLKANKELLKDYVIGLSKNDDPNVRRFISESMRPVVENKWLQQNIEFSLDVLSNLFEETEEYPRVSVANNLSDLARYDEERILEVVEDLTNRNNDDSYFIAYRACRNLVKKYPERVGKLLGIEEYKYKGKVYDLKAGNMVE